MAAPSKGPASSVLCPLALFSVHFIQAIISNVPEASLTLPLRIVTLHTWQEVRTGQLQA